MIRFHCSNNFRSIFITIFRLTLSKSLTFKNKRVCNGRTRQMREFMHSSNNMKDSVDRRTSSAFNNNNTTAKWSDKSLPFEIFLLNKSKKKSRLHLMHMHAHTLHNNFWVENKQQYKLDDCGSLHQN